MNKVRDIFKKINIDGSVDFDVPMRDHTSFRVGGPADVFVVPETYESLSKLLALSRRWNLPLFFLGEGANILVADKGIRGIVASMKSFRNIELRGTDIRAEAGASISSTAFEAAEASLSGLQFIYGMPGSVGGSVFMNARCYGKEIADVLTETTIMNEHGIVETVPTHPSEFSYKNSPFRQKGSLILRASFHCKKGDKKALFNEMDQIKKDREQKGHYLFPSVGSVFKNNRLFGEPTGQIIDKCGLKEYCIGDAQVAKFHGNIIINRGNALATDIKKLIQFIEEEVKNRTGFLLEREVILVGDWEEKENS